MNKLVKRRLHLHSIKKLRNFLRIGITFDFKIIHRIFRASVIIQCSLHQAKGGGWF